MDRSEKIILLTFLGIIGVACCLVLLGGGILLLNGNNSARVTEATQFLATSTEFIVEPTNTPAIVITEAQSDTSSESDTLRTLQMTNIPATDLVTIAEKFNGKKNIPLAITTPPKVYQVGDVLDFWVLNVDSNNYQKVAAHLAYITENVYFWVANGLVYDESELKTLVDTFSTEIYPTDQEFFGREWIPGVDNDSHLYILYAPGVGKNVAGYTSGNDEVLRAAQSYTNEHEMFVINADIQTFSDPYTYAVTAHELQHLIHNYHDPNEESWLNEGFSELAVYLNGYQTGGFDTVFAYNPDLQLNEWQSNSSNVEAHYGASFLFTTYLLDRFGENITKEVVANQANGLESIDDVFESQNILDPVTGNVMSADRLFQDWTIANFLQDPDLDEGRFDYHNYDSVPKFSDSELDMNCYSSDEIRTVHQYGTDYLHFLCNGDFLLEFQGQATVKVIPTDPKAGSYYVWSNKADSSDMTMTHEFDFTGISGEIELTYDTWYDIETDYDYLYLLVSEDEQNWQILHTPSCTNNNPAGNSFGCGYNGQTPTWKNEKVNLSRFAGKKIWLRFEYVTDAAVTGEGFAIDNIEIPKINYSTGFEEDNGGWSLAGFVRMDNQIPQTFLVAVIRKVKGQTSVDEYQLKGGEILKLDLIDGDRISDFTLVVSGSARYSRQEAKYQIQFIQK